MKKQVNIYAPIGININMPSELNINVTVSALQREGADVKLIRYEDAPQAYMEGLRVEDVLLQDGPDAFPITVVGDEVYLKKQYPEYGELLAWSAGRPVEDGEFK